MPGLNNWIAAVKNVFNLAEPAVLTVDSPYYHLHRGSDHFHSVGDVYPTLADGVPLTAGPLWTLSTFVEIVPINTITAEFDIHFISVEGLDTNDVYELHLFQGGSDVLVGKKRFTKNAVQDGIVNVPFQTPVIPANARIRGKLASAAGGSVATISIGYHIY